MSREQHKRQPIGVFDSGIGGLTVANAIIKHLPNEELIYFGDTAHLPYGDKSADAIRYYSLKIVKFLLEQNCKLIVVACNSASSAAYHVLLEFFAGQALFVNVVDPLVETVRQHHFSKVGVIATKATIQSGVYQEKLREAQPDLDLTAMATPLLVPMIEEGYHDDNISEAIISKYLSDPRFENIEALLLACTHYPLIRNHIEDYFNQKIRVFDSTDIVAKVIQHYLIQRDLLNPGRQGPHRFCVSDYTQSFEETTRLFYREKIELEHCPIW